MWLSAIDLASGSVRGFEFGPLRVWIRRTQTTWQYTSQYEAGDNSALGDNPAEGANWTAFVSRYGQSQLFFQPAPPDRPLVVHTEQPFQLAPGARCRLFTIVPLRVRAWLGGPGNELLFDLPTAMFSNAWFGGPMTGRLCYVSPNTLAESAEVVAGDLSSDQAVCPVTVANSADSAFEFCRTAILANDFRIYRAGAAAVHSKLTRNRQKIRRSKGASPPVFSSPPGVLWTSHAIATHSSEGELQLSVDESFQSVDNEFETLTGSAAGTSGTLLARSMILLRRISNYE